MPPIKKILFPVDFSDECIGAARYVEAVAGRFDARILLLHVVGAGEHTLAWELLPQRKAQLDAFLADELKYFNTERVCLTGNDPAAEIEQTAKRWRPDLIMMPTHGVGPFRRLLLGSVTAKVLHDVDCPVWTSIHADSAPPLEDIHCRRILCAVDLGERSQSVLEWAASMAGEYQSTLGIVHATPQLTPTYSSWNLEQEFAQTVATEASKVIGSLQAAAHTAATVFVRPGDPAKVVSCCAKDFGADLLVMGRHSGAGLAGHLRQHAYAILRDSPCPVISI